MVVDSSSLLGVMIGLPDIGFSLLIYGIHMWLLRHHLYWGAWLAGLILNSLYVYMEFTYGFISVLGLSARSLCKSTMVGSILILNFMWNLSWLKPVSSFKFLAQLPYLFSSWITSKICLDLEKQLEKQVEKNVHNTFELKTVLSTFFPHLNIPEDLQFSQVLVFSGFFFLIMNSKGHHFATGSFLWVDGCNTWSCILIGAVIFIASWWCLFENGFDCHTWDIGKGWV